MDTNKWRTWLLFHPLSSCAFILLSRSEQLSFTLPIWSAGQQPRRGAGCPGRMWFQRQDAGEREKRRNTQVPFLQWNIMLGDIQPLLTAEMCVKPGEFCLYCLLLMINILISAAMTCSTLEHLWSLFWYTHVEDCDSLQSKETEWLMRNMDFSHLSTELTVPAHGNLRAISLTLLLGVRLEDLGHPAWVLIQEVTGGTIRNLQPALIKLTESSPCIPVTVTGTWTPQSWINWIWILKCLCLPHKLSCHLQRQPSTPTTWVRHLQTHLWSSERNWLF